MPWIKLTLGQHQHIMNYGHLPPQTHCSLCSNVRNMKGTGPTPPADSSFSLSLLSPPWSVTLKSIGMRGCGSSSGHGSPSPYADLYPESKCSDRSRGRFCLRRPPITKLSYKLFTQAQVALEGRQGQSFFPGILMCPLIIWSTSTRNSANDLADVRKIN